MSNASDHSHALSNQPSTHTDATDTLHTILAQIILLPLEDEEDDFETITTVEEVKEHVLKDATTLQGYTSSIGRSGTRDSGLILILGEIAHQAIANKDLVIALFQAGSAAIGLLAKQGQVKKVEVELNGDRFSIDEPDKATVQRLLDIYEAAHPRKAAGLTSSSTMQITAKISKTK
jgi:hypothetical protein